MVDYYVELSLKQESDIKQIQEELVRLESLWHKREVNSPEKANKMLGLIMDAKKVFASDASRRKYDSDLEASRREPEDPDVSRSKSLEKWTNQARQFYNDGQYDLAKTSMDRALGYAGSESYDGDFFRLASDIYLENNDLGLSLEYINKAIITSPDWADYYIAKARIYERMAQIDQQYGKSQNDINECRNNLMQAVSKAKAGRDAAAEGFALGLLAFSLYFHPNPDTSLAEEYARRAEALGEHSNSKRVLDAVIEKKNSPIYNQAKKEEEYDTVQNLQKAAELYDNLGDWRDASERSATCRTRIKQLEYNMAKEEERYSTLRNHLQKAIELYEHLGDWGDASERAAACRARIDQLEMEEQKRRVELERKAKEEAEERERWAQAELEAQKKKRARTIKFVTIVVPIVAAAIVVVVFVNNIRYHKCGENLKWSYNDETRTLTITGSGSMYNYGNDRKRPWDSDFLYTEIETVIIEDGCTWIGDNAFKSFRAMTNIEIPGSVTGIGGWAFGGCSNLTEIVIPLSVHYVVQSTFADGSERAKIDFSGTKGQWLSFAGDLNFSGIVECSDGSY